MPLAVATVQRKIVVFGVVDATCRLRATELVRRSCVRRTAQDRVAIAAVSLISVARVHIT